MADSREEKPKRPRRRRKPAPEKAAEAVPAPDVEAEEVPAPDVEAEEVPAPDVEAEAQAAPDTEAEAQAAPDTEAEAPPADEIEPTPENIEAEEEAADVEPEAEAEQPPAKPAPRRRRSERDPNLPPPVVRAQARYVRSSARKARLVCDHIRGKSVEEARAILAHAPRSVAHDWSKLLESAVANAEHNHELVGEDLYVKSVQADEGPTIKRYRPRALGRATRIRKRTSHLTILLTPKE
jgi:ribosomal protein L22